MTVAEQQMSIDRKARMKIPYAAPPVRSVAERVRDFREVRLPITPERAIREASRCLQCSMAPCVKACPAGNDIPAALRLIEKGDFLGAAHVYRRTSTMPQICGRICPQEQLCQSSCVRNKNHEPVLCGALEAFVADFERLQNPYTIRPGTSTGKRAAIVGSGPAGLSCAEQLIVRGHRVTVFESASAPGGLLIYGVPAFKLDPSVVRALIEDLLQAGIEIQTGVTIGKARPVDRLFQDGYQAVFLGTGASTPICMQIPGTDLEGVFPPDEFLSRLNVDPSLLPAGWREPLKVGRRIAVIGGGDTASDCLRTALRKGADHVICLYRRTEAEMPGGKKDRALAREEGAEFRFLAQPVRFLPGSDGRVGAIECLECELGAMDAEGRRRPIPVDGSNFIVEADTVVCALGYTADPGIARTVTGLAIDDNGLMQTDPRTGATSHPAIFAGGDGVYGPDLVVTAMAAGRLAAASIDRYLQTL
jgi:glutamate synthase (NADPH/NADH) small chain